MILMTKMNWNILGKRGILESHKIMKYMAKAAIALSIISKTLVVKKNPGTPESNRKTKQNRCHGAGAVA